MINSAVATFKAKSNLIGGETADKQFQKGDIFKCLNMDTRKVLNITPHSKCCQLCHHMENYNLIHKEVTSSIYMYKLHIC